MEEPTFTVAGAEGAQGTADTGEQGASGADASKEAAAGGEQKTAEQIAAEEAATKTGTEEEQAKAKIDADQKKAADEQAAKEAAAKAQVPEKYDLKLPDGVITDEKMMGEFTDWAKENKFSNEQAQKAADLHLKSIGVFAQKLQADAQAQVKAWGAEITDDKELGGARTAETVAAAEKFLTLAEAIPGVNVGRFKADLVRTGMANHPDMIRVARYIGQHVGDDNLFISDRSSGGGQPKSDAEVFYPNQK